LTRQSKHRQKRRERGLCAREGCDKVTGEARLCQRCRELERERSRVAYMARKLRDIPPPGGVA